MPVTSPITLTSLAPAQLAGFDTVIDVRAPSEFAIDHLPGAINLPVLDDAERARVGTLYVQESRFLARKTGAALVARNAARHLEGPLADKPGNWRPLIYCWRGGQRSGALAAILGQIGWPVGVLAGGYQSYRRLVAHALYEATPPGNLILIDGNTGAGKTALLGVLAARGHQVLDLEAMAGHRGSLFGGFGGAQPAQKRFETRLATAMAALTPDRPVFVEAESSRIGEINLPPVLWQAMCRAPRVEIDAPLEARVDFTLRAYDDIAADPAQVAEVIGALVPYHGHAQVQTWQAMCHAGEGAALVRDLLTRHYDPRYAKSRAKNAEGRAMHPLPVASLDAGGLSDAADRLEAMIADVADKGLLAG